jgi:hypothetical protein
MVTPDQGPTVAAQVAQAAQQKMQAQAAPPGIEALLPGVQQQASQSAQAAQPATQGDVNRLRQMMEQAQAQQGQGIAAGADVQMAEGGIVGYSGKDGSSVELDETKLSVNERFQRDLRRLYERMGLADKRAAYLQRTGATPEAIAQKLGREAPVPPTSRPMSEAEIARLQEANVAPSSAAPVPRPPAPERTAQRRPAPEAVVKPAETGLPALMGPAVPSGSERQFGEAMSALGRMEIPQERTPQQIAAEREALYRARGIDPNFMQARMERIAAQERRDQEEAAARAKLVEGRGMENLISRLTRAGGARSGLAGLAEAQLGMEPIIAAQRAGDERFTALMRERQREADKERSALEDMQRALADGDIARAEKSRDAAFAARNAKNATEAEMRGKYAPQLLQAETAAMEVAARAKEGEANRANQLTVAKLQLSKPSDLQERITLLNKDPDKFKRIYGDKTAVDLAELRAKLLADYSKNAMQLKTQNINSFDDYLALFGQAAVTSGATGAGAREFKVLSSRPKQ